MFGTHRAKTHKIISLSANDTYYIATAVIRSLLGPISLFAVSHYLTTTERGYWYLLVTCTLIFNVADLGYSVAVTQVISKVTVGSVNKIRSKSGEIKFLVINQLRRAGRTFAVSLFSMIILLSITDRTKFLLLQPSPAILVLLGSSFQFILTIVCANLEGSGLVIFSQRIKLVSAFSYTSIIAIGLANGLSLHTIGIALIISNAIAFGYFYVIFASLIGKINRSESVKSSLQAEQVKLTKDYLVSFGSGFIIFNAFTPIASYFSSIEFAGKVGMTTAVVMAIFGIAVSPISSSLPAINSNFATNRSDAYILTRAAIQKGLILFGISCCGLITLLFIQSEQKLKLLHLTSALSTTAMILAMYFQIITNGNATFIRASGRDPIRLISLYQAIAVLALTVIVCYLGSYDFIFMPLLFTNFVMFVVTYRKAREYE